MILADAISVGEGDSDLRRNTGDTFHCCPSDVGHASPQTTLGTYFHAGHEWLRSACPTFAPTPASADAAEWLAFCCGTRRKTMQRAFQRAQDEERMAIAKRLWSRVPELGKGPRVELARELPPLRLAEADVRLTTVDRIIDHARRFNRVDGLAASLFLSEWTIEQVLAAAARFGTDKRKATAGEFQWWIEGADTKYSDNEMEQVNAGLHRLEGLSPDELALLADLVERCLVPPSRMLAIESRSDLVTGIRCLKRLVDDPGLIELLVPANLPGRPSPEERRQREEEARRLAALMRLPYRPRKPRVKYASGITFADLEELRQAALSQGISIDVLHGRVPGAREDRHDRLRGSARLGLRIHENSVDDVRSAKVMTRIIAAAAVACRALSTQPPH